MANEFNRSEVQYNSSSVQVELLQAIIEPDDTPYPWNPAAPESEDYFASRERELVWSDWLEEEMAARSQAFFTQLEQIWSVTTSKEASQVAVTAVTNLQASLRSRFAARVPQAWLDAIAHRAYQVFSTHRSMADQLVQCVQELIPSLVEEDLLVLARPFAYAMRGADTEKIDSVLGGNRFQDWEALSEIEQARAGIAIARYAIVQIKSEQQDFRF